MDKVFSECVKDIAEHYTCFSKANRLRIEKWVEKLALSSDYNLAWRRHRNLYARLLLSMVLSKRLEEPFNQFPSDGALPQFPANKMFKFKDLMGSRESEFWRSLYSIVDNREVITSSILEKSALKFESKSSSMVIGKDIQNLSLLLKEQANRIKFLEDQLHEERVKHEIQIQSLLKRHQVQLDSIVQQNSNNDSKASSIMSSRKPLFENDSINDDAFSEQRYSNCSTPNRKTNHVVDGYSKPHSIPQSRQPTHDAASPSVAQRTANTPVLSDSSAIPKRYQSSIPSQQKTLSGQDQSHLDEKNDDDMIGSKLKGWRKDVWVDYMQYLDQFQNEIKGLKI